MCINNLAIRRCRTKWNPLYFSNYSINSCLLKVILNPMKSNSIFKKIILLNSRCLFHRHAYILCTTFSLKSYSTLSDRSQTTWTWSAWVRTTIEQNPCYVLGWWFICWKQDSYIQSDPWYIRRKQTSVALFIAINKRMKRNKPKL